VVAKAERIVQAPVAWAVLRVPQGVASWRSCMALQTTEAPSNRAGVGARWTTQKHRPGVDDAGAGLWRLFSCRSGHCRDHPAASACCGRDLWLPRRVVECRACPCGLQGPTCPCRKAGGLSSALAVVIRIKPSLECGGFVLPLPHQPHCRRAHGMRLSGTAPHRPDLSVGIMLKKMP
jgi:hypothetical protein